MGSDLTYYANAWPGYDNPCVACGAGCRAIDRYCSQCGKADPLGPELRPFLDALTGPPFELGVAFERAIAAGLPIAGFEIGKTRDLTYPVDLVKENFPYLES